MNPYNNRSIYPEDRRGGHHNSHHRRGRYDHSPNPHPHARHQRIHNHHGHHPPRGYYRPPPIPSPHHNQRHHAYQPRQPSGETFFLDRYGANPRTPFQVPQYRVVNEVPLPCKRDEQGLIKELLRCFNCGSKDHKLNDCKIKFDREIVNMNKSWMNDYARIGAKRKRENFNARYFVNPVKGKSLDDLSSTDQKKSEKEPTPPPTLLVWNSSKEVLSDEMKAASPKDDKKRRNDKKNRNYPPNRQQSGRNKGEYDRDIRNYQANDRRPRHHDRRGSYGPLHRGGHNGHRGGPPQGHYGRNHPPPHKPQHHERMDGYPRKHQNHGPRGHHRHPQPRHSRDQNYGRYGAGCLFGNSHIFLC